MGKVISSPLVVIILSFSPLLAVTGRQTQLVMWRNKNVHHLEQVSKRITTNKIPRWSLSVIKCKQVHNSFLRRIGSADHTRKEIEENPVKHLSRRNPINEHARKTGCLLCFVSVL